MVDTASVLAELDELIARRSILEHPFYRAWTAGELRRDQLATYARLYYPHVDAFPGYLVTAMEGAADPAVRAELADNLREERAVPAPHPQLWLRFAAGLGEDAATVAAAAPTPATESTVSAFRELCAGSTAGALAALYAYESQQPEVARRKAEGLQEYYGIGDEATLAYFTVHAEADVRHREGERLALERCLEAGARRDEVLGAAERALDAYWGLLDGVCEAAGVACAA